MYTVRRKECKHTKGIHVEIGTADFFFCFITFAHAFLEFISYWPSDNDFDAFLDRVVSSLICILLSPTEMQDLINQALILVHNSS